ncbi:MAG: TadE/TadG family type IV pilus assembly protein [Chloroflexota bacterium]
MSGSGARVLQPITAANEAPDKDARHPRGQALVEFAIVLMPLLLIVVAIVQFGLLFGANVALTNAAREGARAATIYVYDNNHTKSWNDAQRCGALLTAATDALGLMSASAPHFTVTTTSGACPTTTADTLVNGDLTVSYCDNTTTPDGPCPTAANTATDCVPDTRKGCLVRVSLVYHSDIIVPLVGGFLGTDSNGRFVHQAVATMVVN